MPLSAEVVGSALPIRTPAGNRLVLGGLGRTLEWSIKDREEWSRLGTGSGEL